MRHARTLLSLVVLVSLALVLASSAQQPSPRDLRPPAADAQPPIPPFRPAAPAAGPLQLPDGLKQAILIRTTLIALNHANLSGNYSVLRDLAAPGFQQANNPARLAEIFSSLRQRNLDLGPIAVVEPKLSRQPFIDDQGMLYLIGFFPTRPEQVNFELAFQSVAGQWRLFGISVNTAQAQPQADDSNPGR